MSTTNRNCRIFRVTLDNLEERATPAMWPFKIAPGATPDLLETWGQYQEIETADQDNNIHGHEGIDIAAPVTTEVFAVADGKIYSAPNFAVPYNNVITVYDKAFNGLGWNYKHLIPAQGVTEGKTIKAGALIGTIAPVPNFGPGVSIPTHLHLDRGIGQDTLILPSRKFVIPNKNPFLEFPDIIKLDITKPKILGATFQLAEDNVLAKGYSSTPYSPNNAEFSFGGNEKPRDTARYFDDIIKVGDDDTIHLGRRADAKSASGATSLGKGSELFPKNGNIDIIINAQDIFTGSQHVLNVYQLGFKITGDAFSQTTGFIPSVDFSKQSGIVSVVQSLTLEATRSIYENDVRSNSKLDSQYFYTVTNTFKTDKLQSAFGNGSYFASENIRNYWNSDAKIGKPWFGGPTRVDEESDAKFNYQAEFPDDVYTISIKALDANGNVADKDYKILLQNFTRTLGVDKTAYKAGETVKITSGSGYRALSEFPVYFLRADGNASPPSGTKIDGLTVSLMVSTTKKGLIEGEPVLGEGLGAGDYWVVADYNKDGEFTPELDAVTKIKVTDRLTGLAVNDVYTFAGVIGLTVPAPGVLENDVAPIGSGVTLIGPSPFLGGVFYLNSDGSFFLRVGDFAGPFPVTFSYALSGPNGEAFGQATVTIDRSFGAMRSVTVAPNGLTNDPASSVTQATALATSMLQSTSSASTIADAALRTLTVDLVHDSRATTPPPSEFEYVSHGVLLFDDEWDFDALSGFLLASRPGTDRP